MRHVRIIGLALVAAFALSAAASASAHEFTSTVTGKLKVAGQSEFQVFSTNTVPKTEVKCKKVTVEGEAKAGKQKTVEAKVHYTECTLAVGAETPITAEVVKTKYLFSAEGFVNNLEEAEIKAAGCTVKVPPQNELRTVTYKNSGKDVNVEANITKIKWTQKGTLCELPASGSEASYTGTALTEVEGGEIKWE